MFRPSYFLDLLPHPSVTILTLETTYYISLLISSVLMLLYITLKFRAVTIFEFADL